MLKERKIQINLVKEGFKHEKKEKKVQEKKKEHTIIVKGLPFKKSVTENEESLKKLFSNYGKLKNIRIPADKETQKHKGYAFIDFLNENSATQAVKTVNGKFLDGQELHVSVKMDRDEYLAKKNPKEEEEKKEKVVKKEEPKKPLKLDLDSGEESDANDEELLQQFLGKLKPESKKKEKEEIEEDKEDNEEEDEKEEEEEEKEPIVKEKRKSDPARDLKQTIFLKGIPYSTTEKQIQEIFEKYGPVQYVALVKNKTTKEFNGTAFLKFKFLDGMNKLFESLEESSRLLSLENLQGKKSKLLNSDDYHVTINQKPVTVLKAIDKDKAEKIRETHKDKEDKRNIRLTKEGYIDPFSPQAKKIPAALLKKIQQKLQEKKRKLKNPNNHISDTRILVSNLHKNVDEKELKGLFKEMTNNAKITQIKILKDSEQRSHGFAFVQFVNHDDALQAVRKISNNVKLRGLLLMCEFSIDNARKLQKRHFNIDKTTKISQAPKEETDKKRKREEKEFPRKKF